VRDLRAMGGGSRSPLWVRIIADVTGRPVTLTRGGEISARGAAALAWSAVSGLPLEEVSATMGALGERIVPDPAAAERYRRVYAVQQHLYPRLRGIFTELSGPGGPFPAADLTSRSPR
jgi:xylulokinase